MNEVKLFKKYKKVDKARKILETYSKESVKIWFDRFINFIKTETDMEFEILPLDCDRRVFKDCAFNGIKHKKGKIMFLDCPGYLWLLLHEFGHLASIPKDFRSEFSSRYEIKKMPKMGTPFYDQIFGRTGYAGDEGLAQYWEYFVAKKLDIPTEICGYYLTTPLKEKDYVELLKGSGFYAAKQTGFSTKFGILQKFNA